MPLPAFVHARVYYPSVFVDPPARDLTRNSLIRSGVSIESIVSVLFQEAKISPNLGHSPSGIYRSSIAGERVLSTKSALLEYLLRFWQIDPSRYRIRILPFVFLIKRNFQSSIWCLIAFTSVNRFSDKYPMIVWNGIFNVRNHFMWQLDIVEIKIAIKIYFYELILRRTLIYTN